MSDPSPPSHLLTPEQVAQRLNIKTHTALEMLRPGGPLHPLRIRLGHKTLRVDPVALEAVIAAGGVKVCN